MFKAHVLRRSFSLFSRTPTSAVVKSAADNGHGTIRIQRVRIGKRFFTRTRLMGTAVVAVGAWRLYGWLNEEVEEEEASQQVRRLRRPRISDGRNESDGREVTEDEEDDDDDDEEEGEDDEQEDNGLLFFPTGFSRPKPRTYYRGSDPEWQQFIRLATDRPRMDKIRGELVTVVRNLAVKNPRYKLWLGSIDPNNGSVWMEVQFPDGPPIEYEQPGIELTEDLTLRKSTRPIDQLLHKRLANILQPTAVANALYYDTKRRIFASWRQFKIWSGLEEVPKPPTALGIVKDLTAPASDSPSQTSSPTASSASNPTTVKAVSESSQKQAPSPGSSLPGNPALEKFGLSLPDPQQMPIMNTLYFRMLLRKHQRPMHVEAPRGMFVVKGLVEIMGDKAKMTLDVSGVYDPQTAKYVMLNAKMRTYTPYKQHPRGGP